MAERDVLYSDVNFARPSGNGSVANPPAAESTYSEVRILKGQPSAEGRGRGDALSNGTSKVTPQKAALAALGVLLVALVVALSYLAFDNMQTKRELHTLRHYLPEIPDWKMNGSSCYHFSTIPLSWGESRRLCHYYQGDLVKIDKWDEQMFLVDQLKEEMANAEDKFWIGLTDSDKEGTWKWVDNTPLGQSLDFWFSGEPDNWKGRADKEEDCVRIGETGGTNPQKCWFDRDCEERHRSICEKKTQGNKCL